MFFYFSAGSILANKFINMNILDCLMRKFFAMLKGLTTGEVSIDFVGKTSVSRVPGEVTDGSHN